MTLTQIRPRGKVRDKIAVVTEARLITIWGPSGSTGKSTLALNLAFELSTLGQRVLLIDLDTHAPALTTLLGLKSSPAGLTGAARLIRQGRFNSEELDRLSVSMKHQKSSFRIVPGLSNPIRWPEITPETVSHLTQIARENYDIIIADVASPLEDNLSIPEHSTTRNAASRTTLQVSNLCISILSGTALSLSRYLSQYALLDELQKSRLLIVNQAEPNQSFTGALRNLTKERILATIPEDQTSIQLAQSENVPLALARRKSPARNAIASLAHKLLEWPSVN